MLISDEDLRFIESVVMGKGPRYEKSYNPYLEQFDEKYEVCIPSGVEDEGESPRNEGLCG